MLRLGPERAQTMNVSDADSEHQRARSRRLPGRPIRWIGARLRCASPTMRTIRASRVSAADRSARMTRLPVPLTVPPVTLSPGCFSTGIGSPVTIDSSTALRPSATSRHPPAPSRRAAPAAGRLTERGRADISPRCRLRECAGRWRGEPEQARMAVLVCGGRAVPAPDQAGPAS